MRTTQLALSLLVTAVLLPDVAALGAELDGQVGRHALRPGAFCTIARGRRCTLDGAIARGLFETGLSPRFPTGLRCRDLIDEGYAVDYTYKRDRKALHGGIDIPAPFGTPIVAVADGTVVAKYGEENSLRGREIVLRHSPQNTNLGLWIYTLYAHFDEMPAQAMGQRVHKGEVLGPTGNSGGYPSIRPAGKVRRPAIHFAVWYSTSPEFAVTRRALVPVDAYWMDPLALYRPEGPRDSTAMRALPQEQKEVPIPVMLDDGTIIPEGSKLIWPYLCARE